MDTHTHIHTYDAQSTDFVVRPSIILWSFNANLGMDIHLPAADVFFPVGTLFCDSCAEDLIILAGARVVSCDTRCSSHGLIDGECLISGLFVSRALARFLTFEICSLFGVCAFSTQVLELVWAAFIL